MSSFHSAETVIIPTRAKRVGSAIDVLNTGRIAGVSVSAEVEHSRPSDLRFWLLTPSGRRVLVRDRHRDGFGTASVDVPALAGESLAGEWRLLVDDVRDGDGGRLKGWSLNVATYSSHLLIELDFGAGLTESQKDVFRAATERFQRILIGTKGEPLTVTIAASAPSIDGPGQILGQAGPTRVRSVDRLPTAGVMEFDSADMASMEARGTLPSVLIHEMGHVLGFGTLFALHSMVASGNVISPAAGREYGALLGQGPTPVPLENDGGPGTAGGHWEEDVFASELFTGYISGSSQPISRVSVAAFDDLEYEVDYSQADPYALGQIRMLVAGEQKRACGKLRRPEFVVV